MPSQQQQAAIALGQRIRDARTEKDLTQEGLGLLISVSRQTIAAHESGRCIPNFLRVQDIAIALEIEINFFSTVRSVPEYGLVTR